MGGGGGLKQTFERFQVWSNKEPILLIRRILWVVSSGWALFIAYAIAAVGMVTTLIFAPFGLQAFKFALFALDPITQEPYHTEMTPNIKTSPWHNPLHPFTIAANVLWLIFFGWEIATLHILTAVIQALTIINIGTAITNVKLAAFAIWPFGRSIRKKVLPTTLEELHAQKGMKTSPRERLHSQA